jgi:large subunit ribosomal protein L19
MSAILDLIEKEQCNQDLPDFKAGDKIRVHVRVVEGEKSRIQVFEGTCIAYKKAANRSTITVRKISNGVGVERILPIYSPIVEKIEVMQKGQVRQARIYYLRDLEGKAARIKEEKQI